MSSKIYKRTTMTTLKEMENKLKELQNISPRTQDIEDDIEYYKWAISQLQKDMKKL